MPRREDYVAGVGGPDETKLEKGTQNLGALFQSSR